LQKALIVENNFQLILLGPCPKDLVREHVIEKSYGRYHSVLVVVSQDKLSYEAIVGNAQQEHPWLVKWASQCDHSVMKDMMYPDSCFKCLVLLSFKCS